MFSTTKVANVFISIENSLSYFLYTLINAKIQVMKLR